MIELSLLVCLILHPNRCHEEIFIQPSPAHKICEEDGAVFAMKWELRHKRFEVADFLCRPAGDYI
jgi:hypothetical protein